MDGSHSVLPHLFSLPPLISAVAVPVNRFMFNHVVTEAKFTQPGAVQVRNSRGMKVGG